MKPDAIDHLSLKLSIKFKQANLEKSVLESLLQVLEEEEYETRTIFAGESYIRNNKQKIKQAYLLWEQQKKTDKSKKEIYAYIANCIGNICPKTIEDYVIKFTKGYNPTKKHNAYSI